MATISIARVPTIGTANPTRNDPREASARLFAAMRLLDALRLDLIVAEPAPPSGLGAAIMDRLRKAAGR